MKALLSTYFEIDDVIDISMNVQKSAIKQKDRKQKFLAKSTHYQLAKEAISQVNSQLSTSFIGSHFLQSFQQSKK